MSNTYKELLAQREALEAQIQTARKQEVSDVIAKIRGLVQDYGLTADDIFTARRASSTVAPSSAIQRQVTPGPDAASRPPGSRTRIAPSSPSEALDKRLHENSLQSLAGFFILAPPGTCT